jgi:AMMECR1 domain-containing protein
MQIEQLLNVGLGLTKDEHNQPLYIALKALSEKINHLKSIQSQEQNTASHHEKCAFVSFNHVSR